MFCVGCGHEVNLGEQICKGCGKLSHSMREEVLALSEKTVPHRKCKTCGTGMAEDHHFCCECGAPEPA